MSFDFEKYFPIHVNIVCPIYRLCICWDILILSFGSIAPPQLFAFISYAKIINQNVVDKRDPPFIFNIKAKMSFLCKHFLIQPNLLYSAQFLHGCSLPKTVLYVPNNSPILWIISICLYLRFYTLLDITSSVSLNYLHKEMSFAWGMFWSGNDLFG